MKSEGDMRNENFVEGIAILGKYLPEGKHDIRAEHDQIWIGSVDMVTDSKDEARLLELGWDKDEEADGWSCQT